MKIVPEDMAPLPVVTRISLPRDDDVKPEDNITVPDAPDMLEPVANCIEPETEKPSPERNDVSPLNVDAAEPLEIITRPPRPDAEAPALA